MRLQYVGGLLAAMVLGVGCQADGPTIEEVSSSQIGGSVLNTFGPDFLQIDQLNGGPQDANLFLGDDPADGSLSRDFPAGSGTFIDWEDLAAAGEDNFLYDLDDPALGKDPSSFPRSNECVGPSTVLSKMDLTYAGAYNNMEHAYFVVQRSDNSGDAAYYWLFTKVEPTAPLGESPCRATEHRLMYTISEGDILFSGHFKPSASLPLLRVFVANADAAGLLTAVQAIDFTSGLWTENASAIEAVAVNTTITQPGTLGYAGIKKLLNGDDGTAIGTELIAELAVDTAIFTGGQPCGATFFGSVISRSSGSGGTSPDLKDLIGPAIFNFGETSAEATMVSECSPSADYEGHGFSMDGSPLVNPTCHWVFDTGATSESCSGTVAMPRGSHFGTLTITDTVTGCSATVDTAPVEVFGDVTAAAEMSSSCELAAHYSGSGVDSWGEAIPEGSMDCLWSFDGSITSEACSGVQALPRGPHTGVFTLIDSRSGCSDTADAETLVYGDVVAFGELTPTCSLEVGYAGRGEYTDGAEMTSLDCHWEFDGGGASDSCAGAHLFGAPGLLGAALTVTDPVSACSNTVFVDPINVYAEMAATADLIPTCELSFSYLGGVTGGSGSFGYDWAFSGAGVVSPATSSSKSGVAGVSLGATEYTGVFTATDLRTDGVLCQASAADAATPYAPVVVHLTPSTLAPICLSDDDSVTYYALASGGNGDYSFAWHGWEACSGGASCTIDPSNSDFCAEVSLYVTADDSTPLCDADDSEIETYSKVTIINASDNL